MGTGSDGTLHRVSAQYIEFSAVTSLAILMSAVRLMPDMTITHEHPVFHSNISDAFYSRHPSKGLSLIELLIALALSAIIIASTMRGILLLSAQVNLSADRVEIIERARHSSLYLSDLLTRSAPSKEGAKKEGAKTRLLCDSPSVESSVGTIVLSEPGALCLALSDRRKNTPALWVDALEECPVHCEPSSWPAYVWVQPGCHPVFNQLAPELRVFSQAKPPTECIGSKRYALWSRSILYLRDYAWRRGDGIGALMIHRLGADGVFSRAEMLVWGLESWAISRYTGEIGTGNQQAGSEQTGSGQPSSWRLRLLFHGEVRDSLFDPSALSAWAQSQLRSSLGGVTREEVSFRVAAMHVPIIDPL